MQRLRQRQESGESEVYRYIEAKRQEDREAKRQKWRDGERKREKHTRASFFSVHCDGYLDLFLLI